MRSSSNAARGTFATALALIVIAIFASGVAVAQNQPGGDKPAGDDKPDTVKKDDKTPAAPAGDKTGDGNGSTTKPDTGTPDGNGTGTPDGNGTGTTPGDGTPATTPGTPATTPGTPPENNEDVPINLRLRRLEQRVQALKERAWRAKARVGMLKEAVLGGGIGARATLVHKNKMGNSFRLIKLVYALDGTQIFARSDDSGALHKNKTFDVLTGPIAPGSHTISVLAIYRGHGYGVFKYLNKYRFTVRSSHTFTAAEGKATRVEVKAYERGGVTTKLEKRPAIDFKVTHSTGAK
jgi:hypothetical protein